MWLKLVKRAYSRLRSRTPGHCDFLRRLSSGIGQGSDGHHCSRLCWRVPSWRPMSGIRGTSCASGQHRQLQHLKHCLHQCLHGVCDQEREPQRFDQNRCRNVACIVTKRSRNRSDPCKNAFRLICSTIPQLLLVRKRKFQHANANAGML